MRLTQPVVIALLALAAIAVGCATLLILNGDTVPPELWALAFAAITGATGIAVPAAPGAAAAGTQPPAAAARAAPPVAPAAGGAAPAPVARLTS